MSKKKGIIRLVVLLAVIAFVVYTAVSGLGSDRSGSLNDISLGLDLRGGVSITYEASGDEEPSAGAFADETGPWGRFKQDRGPCGRDSVW